MDDFEMLLRWCAVWSNARNQVCLSSTQLQNVESALDRWLSSQMGFLGGILRPGVTLLDISTLPGEVVFTLNVCDPTRPDFGATWTEKISKLPDDSRWALDPTEGGEG